MFKLYVGALNGNSLYKESENKQELVEAYNTFCKENIPAIKQFMDGDRNITEDLQQDKQTQIERFEWE